MLLRRGAARVFAVDAGHGQLLGELRADARVVNLERTNLAQLGRAISPQVEIGVVTMDLSYLSIAEAAPQLEPLRFAADADLIGLVKPMFELHLPAPPTHEGELEKALRHALRGVEHDRRWRVIGTMPSPVSGKRGAREWLLHARRRM